jgi:hypothetical protein
VTIIVTNGLSAPQRTVIMRAAVAAVAFLLLCLFAEPAAAQEQPQGKRDDLDVTMQIIVDPDAKLPDEVVRRIPLPTRKAAESPPPGTTGGKPESAGGGKDKDRAEAEERRRERGPPDDRPNPPNRPPRD